MENVRTNEERAVSLSECKTERYERNTQCDCVYVCSSHIVRPSFSRSLFTSESTYNNKCYAVCDIRTLGLFLKDVAPT